MRVVNQLTADGTISRDDVEANLKRKAEILREKAEKRELKRSKRDGATNARLPRLIAPGVAARGSARRMTRIEPAGVAGRWTR